jgi:hypothetical protein
MFDDNDDDFGTLDFPSVWEMTEQHVAQFVVAERDRWANVKAEERKLDVTANRKRVHKHYWKDPVAARIAARDRMRAKRARLRNSSTS